MSLAAFQRRIFGEAGNRIAWRAEDVTRIADRFGLRRDVDALPFEPTARSTSLPVIEAKAEAGEGRSYVFVISTGAVDRVGDVIDPNGWHLGNYQRNPVVLFAHRSTLTPIGKAVRTWRDGAHLKSEVRLAPASASPAAEEVRALIAEGYLRAASVGFMPLDWEFTKDPARSFGINFKAVELLEWSIVPIPANPECLLGEGQAGKALASDAAKREAAKRRRQRDLDQLRVRGVVP